MIESPWDTEDLTHFSLTSSLDEGYNSEVVKMKDILIDPFLVPNTMVRCFTCLTSLNSHKNRGS